MWLFVFVLVVYAPLVLLGGYEMGVCLRRAEWARLLELRAMVDEEMAALEALQLVNIVHRRAEEELRRVS